MTNQLSRDDLRRMSADEIVEADKAGRFAALYGLEPRDDDGTRQLDRADLQQMKPDEIVRAADAGRCADLYAGNLPATDTDH